MNRTIAVGVAAFALGLLLGSSFAPISLWPRASVERENAALEKEVNIYKGMVREYESEREAVRAVLSQK